MSLGVEVLKRSFYYLRFIIFLHLKSKGFEKHVVTLIRNKLIFGYLLCTFPYVQTSSSVFLSSSFLLN